MRRRLLTAAFGALLLGGLAIPVDAQRGTISVHTGRLAGQADLLIPPRARKEPPKGPPKVIRPRGLRSEFCRYVCKKGPKGWFCTVICG